MASHLRTLAVLLVLIVTAPTAAAAQFESVTAPASGPPVTAWGSIGVGPGSLRNVDGLVAGILRANVSVGPWLLTYRDSDVGPFMDSGSRVRDRAILAGVRSGGHRLFASGALGYGSATPYSPADIAPTGMLAYDATLHASAYVVGFALSLSGDLGPSNVSYTAFTLSLEIGWFGR